MEKIAKELSAKTKVHTAQVDVSSYSDVQAATKATAGHYGKIRNNFV